MRSRIADERVEKEARALVGVLQFPGLSAVRGLIDSRFVAIAARHHIRRLGIECFDIAKIEVAASSDAQLFPRLSFVGRAQDDPFGTGGPNYVVCSMAIHFVADAHATQIGIKATGLDGPPGFRRGKTWR